jgi:hypothetical protein
MLLQLKSYFLTPIQFVRCIEQNRLGLYRPTEMAAVPISVCPLLLLTVGRIRKEPVVWVIGWRKKIVLDALATQIVQIDC